MVVVVLTNCPAKLRGHLTRWLLEISAGVYVGHVPARVRDLLWNQVVEYVKDGKALMVHSTVGEQRLAFRTHQHEWEPVDYDGVLLMRRPADNSTVRTRRARRGWSTASQRRRWR
ncbi:type I-E CRISPR-associated endoribonuclease Cas2 [Gordonia pseudamarae]|jgi:CRISPR-associated protein Cas2|uniref:Type I-E CRISPR-associated endoribonuclease Cas2 n=1 Tax=Gordonia pseudamarae TaxID=2831662 RepID=A0ABX6INQ7_9ACTN|nr:MULTISPECIES: type I-E CRISPR-associated endoribonuclease Cas2e [Gordonia]MBD0022137.1 type I-E CRISPR-associated endoribonuclease Cas2 [Gordonia sp. (in: high G+C Gram-positive bacteria)]QHN28157.1 type I-E CRISPR-associated endoribonuclease Cas2 [Gordonia pseudamarae]QHN37019.1 type I-E CRISPR-associated endoribonuclease Cas2 [Gordonia pseudamarae]